jgi:WD40 repeat protein
LTYLEHQCHVTCVVVSPQDLVFSGDQNHFVHVWDLNLGQTLRILTGHSLPVCSLSISNTSSLCAPVMTSSSNPFSGATNWSPRDCSSHSILASGSEDGHIFVWKISNYDLVCDLAHPSRGQPVAVVSLCLSKNSSTLLVSGGSCGTIALWRLSTQELLHVFEGHFGPVSGLAIYEDPHFIQSSDDCPRDHQDLLLVSSSADWTIRVWNLATKTLIRTLEGHSGGVECLALYIPSSTHGRGGGEGAAGRSSPIDSVPSSKSQHSPLIISGGRDETIRVWDLMTGVLYRNLEDHADTVYARAVSTTDTSQMLISGITSMTVTTTSTRPVIVSGGADCSLQLWNLDRIICDINWERRKHFGQFIFFIRHRNGKLHFHEIPPKHSLPNTTPTEQDHPTPLSPHQDHESKEGGSLLFPPLVAPAQVPPATAARIYQSEMSAFLQSCEMDEICYLIAAYL